MTKSRGIYKRVILPRRLSSILEHESVEPEPNTGCWLWSGSTNEHGYGQLTYQGRVTKAHRLAWELAHGSIPAGMGILHRCNMPRCVNPDHLRPGTQAENYMDMVSAGRQVVLRGEQRPRAKLTSRDVLAIREDARSHAVIARQYGIAKGTIGNIKSRRIWSWL